MKKIFFVYALLIFLLSCNSQKNIRMNSTIDWKKNTNIYEVNIRQYTPEGTFKAFESHLPRLKNMGVKTLWFMPITPIAQKNKKGTMGSQYACSSYTKINPEFGTLQDFKNLVNKAHQMGFKVLIDWVANHTGWDHEWTITHPDYYLIDPKTNDFQIASGMEDIIELDYKNPKMRNAMIDAMKFWVKETNIDGFRCDLASWVELDFWQEARPKVDALKPLFWLGEFDELENPDYGKVFDASYIWTWMHKTKDYNEGKANFNDLKNLIQRYSSIGNSSMRAWFTSNHDENTWNGTEYEKYGVFAQTLAVFSITWNGIPLIYNAQEIPLRNKRLAFFEKDPIPWSSNLELHYFYQKLLELKSENPALFGGDDSATTQILSTTENDKILAYSRKNGKSEVITLLNFSKENVKFKIQNYSFQEVYQELFFGGDRKISNETIFSLEPGGFAVYHK